MTNLESASDYCFFFIRHGEHMNSATTSKILGATATSRRKHPTLGIKGKDGMASWMSMARFGWWSTRLMATDFVRRWSATSRDLKVRSHFRGRSDRLIVLQNSNSQRSTGLLPIWIHNPSWGRPGRRLESRRAPWLESGAAVYSSI